MNCYAIIGIRYSLVLTTDPHVNSQRREDRHSCDKSSIFCIRLLDSAARYLPGRPWLQRARYWYTDNDGIT